MIFRHMERDLKLDMEAKKNLKGFSIGVEAGWYVTPLHFQRFVFLVTISVFFLYFIFWQHPAFASQKERQSASQNLQEFSKSGKPFPRTDDCLHLTRHLLLSHGFYKIPILHRLTACGIKGSSILIVKSSAGVWQGNILLISWLQVSKCQGCCFTQNAQHYLFADLESTGAHFPHYQIH